MVHQVISSCPAVLLCLLVIIYPYFRYIEARLHYVTAVIADVLTCVLVLLSSFIVRCLHFHDIYHNTHESHRFLTAQRMKTTIMLL